MSFASDFFIEKKIKGKIPQYTIGQVLNFPLRTNFQKIGISQDIYPSDLERSLLMNSKKDLN